jgi:hypothetical protein
MGVARSLGPICSGRPETCQAECEACKRWQRLRAAQEKKARLGKAGLGKGGNLGMGSIYLFFFAFFFAAIGLFSSCLED